MGKYGMENFRRFQTSGVTPEDIRTMKIEAVRDAFTDTKEDIDNLVMQLAEGIRERRWTAILGDDVSGRIVANVIGEIASRYAHERGGKPPTRFFFSGGSIPYDEGETSDLNLWDVDDPYKIHKDRQRNLEKYIHSLAPKLGDRVLIVTEQLRSGTTIRRIGKILEKNNIHFDIASMWSKDTAEKHGGDLAGENLHVFKGANVYSGKEYGGASDPFGSKISHALYTLGKVLNEATGVKKSGISPVTKRNTDADQNLINVAHEETRKLADEFYEKYFNIS